MFRDKRVNHSFHYFLQISPFFSYLNPMAAEFWHFPKLLYEEGAEGHRTTASCNVRALTFINSGTLPKYTQQPSFISVQEAGCQASDISAGTHKQQDYGQQTMTIENGRHSEAREATSPYQAWIRSRQVLVSGILKIRLPGVPL